MTDSEKGAMSKPALVSLLKAPSFCEAEKSVSLRALCISATPLSASVLVTLATFDLR